MKQLNEFEKHMLFYRIDNLKSLKNKEFMASFAGIVNDFDLLQEEDYKNLQNHDWCRDNIMHEYTIIKQISKNVSDLLVDEKKDNTGRQRYYDNVFYLRGKNVLLSSEWYNGKGKKRDNKTCFIKWLMNLVDERINNDKTKRQSIDDAPLTNVAIRYRNYITAIKSKPFMLLAGLSGTGKSRIVRELARLYWNKESKEYEAQKPKNFEIIQVKPNWHDSSELIGYVSRIGADKDGNGITFVAGDFLRFLAKAWEDSTVPYFLCLDEMNLAPVEQYFAEYLSAIESRKADASGDIKTDPIIKSEEKWFSDLINNLTRDEKIRMRFNNEGICIPQNLIVVGTVNMDETTFSFSRKVLDRAMTIEMNEVDLREGLINEDLMDGIIDANLLIGRTVEGKDVYKANKDVCNLALNFLEAINGKLEGTPFKIAYRTRNEFLLYVVNNLSYNKGSGGLTPRRLPALHTILLLPVSH